MQNKNNLHYFHVSISFLPKYTVHDNENTIQYSPDVLTNCSFSFVLYLVDYEYKCHINTKRKLVTDTAITDYMSN